MSKSHNLKNDFYKKEFYDAIKSYSLESAEVIVPLILDIILCRSIVDIGCGDGTWLKVFHDNGVKDILGIDGSYVDENILVIPKSNFISCDLENPGKLENKFDIAISLEVAEHLPIQCASLFIDYLTSLSDVIVFSAAIPGQGGENHINEQWPEYWSKEFSSKGYIVFDYLRKKVWNNEKVAAWYRQNLLLFIKQSYYEKQPFLQEILKPYEVTDFSLLSIVHPEIFSIKIDMLKSMTISLDINNYKRQTFLKKIKTIMS
ncbi:hypothetical protein NIES4072_34890 [Nostoc commune NIES-4072]|uniref:Uncharacterized protein n=1 Tax=Nostoc commune NIES-4072 TaxID=2005467 RepID=A0A2R5FM34_NOSCO|nr:methyltransferase domain-containing protein [Nostoc commune]BBD69182.1 hypothetical protein NIES4070_55900 [Nostoc commune HK-02]GBG19820.1 hypothetical protein NIES4072_34890 [Nostoc commune NIES-4072]